MTKKPRVYKLRLVGGKVMMPADLERLHKYMLEIEGIDHISDDMRAVVEELCRAGAQASGQDMKTRRRTTGPKP
jgi:hypothetical protein